MEDQILLAICGFDPNENGELSKGEEERNRKERWKEITNLSVSVNTPDLDDWSTREEKRKSRQFGQGRKSRRRKNETNPVDPPSYRHQA